MHKEGQHIVETAVESRAGFIDRPVLIVMSISIVLVIGFFAAIFVFAR
jgi:hypothetical protein